MMPFLLQKSLPRLIATQREHPRTGAPPTDFDAFSFSEEPLPQVAEKKGIPHVATSLDYDAFSFDEPPPPVAGRRSTRAEIARREVGGGRHTTLPHGDDEFSATFLRWNSHLNLRLLNQAPPRHRDRQRVKESLPTLILAISNLASRLLRINREMADRVAVEQETWQEKKQPSFEGGGGEASSADRCTRCL